MAAVRRAERRGLRALRRAGRNGCAPVGAAGTLTATDATAVRTGGSELVTARGDLPGGGSQGADAKGGGADGGTATDGGNVKHGASGGGAQGGVAGISATRSVPESDALNHIAPLLLLVLLALAAAGVVASRARSHKDGFSGGRWFAALLPAAAATATLPEERPRTVPITTPARTLPPPAAAPVRDRVPPPDARRSWIAEVQWRESRFTVVARAGDDEPSVALATTAPLRWPPADAGAVREMQSAVERLGTALLATGWRPLPDGSAWYAKRFAWTAAGAPARSEPPHRQAVAGSPRGEAEPIARGVVRQTEWPAGTEDLWRCEITWRSGYRKSCFRAVARGPASSRGSTIALSDTYKWLIKDDPDVDTRYVAEVRRLADRLIGGGWEPVGRGRHWYELRFVWRRDGAPSDGLTPAR